MSSNRNLILSIALSAFVGVVIGALGMAYLSRSAGQYFVEELRHRLAGDQESRGQSALKHGDISTALHHYRNAVFLTTANPDVVFEKTKSDWSLSYPFTGSAANFLYANADSTTLKAREGISRARLARALELSGLKKEAQEQYEAVATLMGFGEIDKAKTFAVELMKDNSEKK